jgi:hypothetical protein
MAELGAAVVAFMSLAGVIRPLYAVVSGLQEAPNEVIFFRHQLESLECIVSELEHLQGRVSPDIFSHRLRSGLSHVRVPLEQDVATLQKLLVKARAKNSESSLRGRIWWRLNSGEIKQLGERLGQYREILNTLLVLLHRWVIPLVGNGY